MLSRRMILKYGLGGLAVLTAGGIGLSLQSTKMQEPSQRLKVLSLREFSILWAIAESMLPAHGSFPPASQLNIAEKVDDLLSRCNPAVGAEISQVLMLFENAAINTIFDQTPTPFSQEDPEQQKQRINYWRNSKIPLRRTAYQALNGICGATYYSLPEINELMNYPGPPQYMQVLKKNLDQPEEEK